MRRQLKTFPTYEELKALDKNYEWYYDFPSLLGSGHLRLYYNEEFYKGKISLDIIEQGFLHNTIGRISKDMYYNNMYPLNKKNYNAILKAIQTQYLDMKTKLEEYNIGNK